MYNGILRRKVSKKDAAIASFFLGNDVSNELIATPSSTYDAIASVYTNAERLLLVIFNKFDSDEDLCISIQEMNAAVSVLLQNNMLDDRYD